jgi:hypothetical protein
MARKGDIDSKSVASRIPMDVYIRLLTNSSAKGETISNYVRDVLSNEQKQLDQIKHLNEEIANNCDDWFKIYELFKVLMEFPGVTEVIKKHPVAKVLMHEYLK